MTAITRDVLVRESGHLLRTLGAGLSDEDIVTHVGGQLLGTGSDEGLLLALSIAKSGYGQSQMIGMYRWAEGGFPVVAMGHRFAAAMALTTATEEVVDSARPPFPSYLLEVPDGTVSMVDPSESGGLEDVRYVLVTRIDSTRNKLGFAWAYNAMAASGHVLYRHGVTSSELLPSDIEATSLESGIARSYLLTEHDQRACAVIGRLIVNTALAMSDPRNVREPGPRRVRHRVNSAFGGRMAPEPTCRTYVLGKDVQLSTDLRSELRRYLSGERRSPSVQVLVSGHYKMQPYGPESKLRKLIWREPYWRGPEDAPIPIRSHVLGGESP